MSPGFSVRFNPLDEAKKLLQGGHFILIHEEVRVYKDGYYQILDDRVLLNHIAHQLYNKRNQSRLSKSREVLETFKNILTKKTSTLDLTIEPTLINVQNGLLDIETMRLYPHTHKRVYLYRINASYNPDAKCFHFSKFLDEVLVDESLRPDKELALVVQEFIGYCLYAEILFHKALIFHGQGDNGKSTLIFVIEELFKDLVSHIHFEDIGVDRFASADLAGKLVNISSEFSVSAKLRDSDIKSIIAGDTIRAQRKYQRAFNFRPVARHIITTNNLPLTMDTSYAFFRRFDIVPFRQTFLSQKEYDRLSPQKKRGYEVKDTYLKKKLISELDGIFLWAVKGLKRLLKNGDFTSSRQVEEMKKIFRMRSMTVESFIERHFDASDATKMVLLQEAYKEYVNFCQEHSVPPLGGRKFSERLKQLGYIVEPGTGNQIYVKGVRLKTFVRPRFKI
jgi:putative DNA primase/helicase